MPRPFNDSDSSRENKVLSEDFDEGTPWAIKKKESELKHWYEKPGRNLV